MQSLVNIRNEIVQVQARAYEAEDCGEQSVSIFDDEDGTEGDNEDAEEKKENDELTLKMRRCSRPTHPQPRKSHQTFHMNHIVMVVCT